MRVLHVSPSIERSFGGPTYSLAAYARAAAHAGAEVTVAAATDGPAEEIAWFRGELTSGALHHFARSGRGAFARSPELHRWLRANAARFDVVHVHGLLNPVSSLALRYCTRRGLPVVVRPFGTLSRYTFTYRRSWLKRGYFRVLDGPSLNRAGGVHFTTDAERHEAAWHGADWSDRAFVIPPPWIDGAGDRSPASHLAGGRGTPTVLFLSRLHPVKQVEALLDAWPLVRQRVPAAQLIIAGDGEPAYAQALQQRAAALGSDSGVRFTGFADGRAKAALLAAADVFVLPSLHENFGIAVLEAMAAGVPVVVAREVQLSAFALAHGLGVVSERSPDALSQAILAVLQDDVLSARCRDEGAGIVAGHFAPPVIGNQLVDMYRAVNKHTLA